MNYDLKCIQLCAKLVGWGDTTVNDAECAFLSADLGFRSQRIRGTGWCLAQKALYGLKLDKKERQHPPFLRKYGTLSQFWTQEQKLENLPSTLPAL